MNLGGSGALVLRLFSFKLMVRPFTPAAAVAALFRVLGYAVLIKVVQQHVMIPSLDDDLTVRQRKGRHVRLLLRTT